MVAVIEIVRSIRNVRAQYNVETGKLIDASIYTTKLASLVIRSFKALKWVFCFEGGAGVFGFFPEKRVKNGVH